VGTLHIWYGRRDPAAREARFQAYFPFLIINWQSIIFSLPPPAHRNTGKLQHKIEPPVQVPPETAIHRKKDPPDPAKPLASPVFGSGERGKRRFLKGEAGRLQKKKKRIGKQRSNNETLGAFNRARRPNPEN
jgi:hypothetical protein